MNDVSSNAKAMKEQPRISVIIPAYNAERTIYKTLDSIFGADYPADKLEVILVDNNSNDETLLVSQRFRELTVIEEKTQGRSYARNTGARQSCGEFLFFLDADVYVEEDFFMEMLKVLSRQGVGGVQGKIIPSSIDGQESINRYRYRSIKSSTAETFCLLNLMVRESPMINSAACGYRREAFELVRGFDTELERHEDIDLSRRVCYSGYHLASAEKATANVIYHGEGWKSYFIRSFQDGYTKIDYNRKWSLEQKWLGMEEDENYIREIEKDHVTPVKEEVSQRVRSLFLRGEKKEVPFNPLNYIWWAYKDLSSALKSYIKTLDPYYLLLFINHICKLTGRVLGPLRTKRHFGPLEIYMAPPKVRMQRVYVKGGRPYLIRPTLRFILLTDKIYLIDIAGHQLLGENPDYPYLFSYYNFQKLGLFKDFEGNSEEDMVFEILNFMNLLKK